MRRIFVSVLFTLITLCIPAFAADKSDWYLYVWSEDVAGDWGQFEVTDKSNIFVIPSCEVSVKGIKFCVRNGDWSKKYGWKELSVTATATPVELAEANGANGWLDLPVASYKVTFNSTSLTIQFDEADEQQGGGEEDKPDHSDSRQFLRGGDLTMVTYIEDFGTTFRYEDGSAGDVFDILSHYGVNLARLRLYNAPGTGVKDGSTTYRTPILTTKHPTGYPYAGEDDIAALALRAKQHNMKICLTFYLSDYWSGATNQYIPAAWAEAGSLQALGDSVYNYVYRFMTRMKEQGTTPEYVSIGNESDYGILYQDLNKSYVSYGGHTTQNGIANAVFLFNKAYDAVKAVSAASQVIIHHTGGDQGRSEKCRSFFQSLTENGGKFDIVGGSYYPKWSQDHNSTDDTPAGMLVWAKLMEQNFHKPVIIMETGYSWTQYRPSGRNGGNYEGQLGMNGSYNEASEKGQCDFMCDLHDKIASDENIVGYMYWDPIFVDQQVKGSWITSCWAEKYDPAYNQWWEAGNVISNTTWFDYSGKPLQALYKEVNSRQSPTTKLADPQTVTRSSTAYKVMEKGQLYIIRENHKYTIAGIEIQ